MPTDLGQLRTFVTVAEELNLTRAAERLHISQSAAGAHVRALEEALATQLFLRVNRTLVLTRVGQLVLQEAKSLLNYDAQFTSFVRQLSGKIEGTLVLGASSEPGTRIGKMMAVLRANYPLISVDLRARPSLGTRQGLKSGELDVGILLGSTFDPRCTSYQLTTVRYRLAGSAVWKDQIESGDWTQLASLPWLTPTASSAYATMLSEMFGNRGLELNSVIRFENAAMARAALQEGAGVMLIREEHALQGEQDGQLALSPVASAEVALSMAHQTSRKDDPLIKAFIEAAAMSWPEMKQMR